MSRLEELLVEIPLSRLRKAPWNYKVEDPAMAAKLEANIARNGQLENIVVREIGNNGAYEIINGNHRYDAMEALGFETVTCANLGTIDLEHAKRIAVELNETRFESDSQKLSELLISVVDKFGRESVLDTSPFDEAMLKTLTDPNLFLGGGPPDPGGRDGPRFEAPFAFTLRFTEEQSLEWMSMLKKLRSAYQVERNEEALLTILRMHGATAAVEGTGFTRILALLPPGVQGTFKIAEEKILEMLEEEGGGLPEDPHLRAGRVIELLTAEFIASYGAENGL